MNGATPIHDDDHGDTVSLKHYIERILDERDKAVQVAYRNLEQRLDRLNELRAEVQQDRGQFLRLDVYDEKHEALERLVTELERTMRAAVIEAAQTHAARLDNLEAWRLKAVGVGLIAIPLSGLIGAAIMKAFGG